MNMMKISHGIMLGPEWTHQDTHSFTPIQCKQECKRMQKNAKECKRMQKNSQNYSPGISPPSGKTTIPVYKNMTRHSDICGFSIH